MLDYQQFTILIVEDDIHTRALIRRMLHQIGLRKAVQLRRRIERRAQHRHRMPPHFETPVYSGPLRLAR